MYSKILVAHERMNDASHALDKAAALATMLHAELFVLGIVTPGPEPLLGHHKSVEELAGSAEFKQLREQAETWATKQQVRPRVETHVGHAIHLIEHFASEFGADLLVLGDIEHTGSWGPMLEHGSDRVSLCTRCDVLIIR